MARLSSALIAVLIALAASAAWAQTETIETQPAITRVCQVFFLKRDTDSPYQGYLCFTPAEYAALTPATLRAAQRAQYQAWRAERDRPPRPPTNAEKRDELRALKDQRQELISRIDALQLELGE